MFVNLGVDSDGDIYYLLDVYQFDRDGSTMKLAQVSKYNEKNRKMLYNRLHFPNSCTTEEIIEKIKCVYKLK